MELETKPTKKMIEVLDMFKKKEKDSVKNCALYLGNWNCELKKIIRKGSKWTKLKTSLKNPLLKLCGFAKNH